MISREELMENGVLVSYYYVDGAKVTERVYKDNRNEERRKVEQAIKKALDKVNFIVQKSLSVRLEKRKLLADKLGVSLEELDLLR